MSQRFLIADTHFYDENIMKFEGRPFKTVEEMNTQIVDNWNSVVSSEDIVYMLGDFFGYCAGDSGYFKVEKIVNDLKGCIVLIRGNHETDEQISWFKKLGIEVIEYPIVLDNFYILSHEPMYVSENMPYANVFGHIHNNPMYKTCSSRSYCVSVERINYTPILFDIIKHSILNENKTKNS